jgi:hypothetical protein
MSYVHARKKKRSQNLTAQNIYSVMRSLFPKKNDFGTGSYQELVTELNSYGITTLGGFIALMKKHRRALLEVDQAYLSVQERKVYREVYSPEEVAESVRRRYWYAYPGLVRNAAELEFGEIAEVSANET